MRTFAPLVLVCAGLSIAAASPGCSCEAGSDDADTSAGPGNGGSTSNGTASGEGGMTGSTTNGFSTSTTPACENLECQQFVCDGSAKTTVTGTVYDPSGTLPLYNVIVYVPNAPVGPVPDTLTCDKCDAQLSGSPLVSTLTDTQGKFTLENVPVGANIPLVMQVGKWRRMVTIPTVAECVENPLTNPEMTRLPRIHDAENNLPRIALSTGGANPLFCLLQRLGLDQSAYGVEGSDARIHFYRGANGAAGFDGGFGTSPGGTFTDGPTTLWESGWSNYDIVLLSCEGSEEPDPKANRRVKLRDYVNAGGRAFATHYHYNWFQGDAPADLQSVASFSATSNSFDGIVDIDQSFPKGIALADWLFFVDGASPLGQFNVVDGRRHNTMLNQMLSRLWVTRNAGPVYFSFNAPIGVPEEQQCGKMVFSDIHVSANNGDPNGNFPSACNNNPLTEQEKALIFMLFDLSACITPDDEPPPPPPM